MKQRVLIAEDDDFLLKFINGKLEEEGFEVDCVTRGDDVLLKMEENKYNLVLTDLIMPNLDGFALLAELKDRNSQVPILVYSSLGQPKDEAEVLRLGAKAFLDKTHSLDSLVALIKKYAV